MASRRLVVALLVALAGCGSSGPRAVQEQPPETVTSLLHASCADARAAGKGPFREGQDPEYRHYEDRDGDGVVCEGGG